MQPILRCKPQRYSHTHANLHCCNSGRERTSLAYLHLFSAVSRLDVIPRFRRLPRRRQRGLGFTDALPPARLALEHWWDTASTHNKKKNLGEGARIVPWKGYSGTGSKGTEQWGAIDDSLSPQRTPRWRRGLSTCPLRLPLQRCSCNWAALHCALRSTPRLPGRMVRNHREHACFCPNKA